MLKYDTFIMHHVAPQMCYYRRCAIWSASLICTTRTAGFSGNEIFICVRKHGDDYVILIQLMPHCSLWVVPGSQGYLSEHCTLLKHCCVSVHLDVMDQAAVHKVILRWLHTIWTLKTFGTSYKKGRASQTFNINIPPDRNTSDHRLLFDDLLSHGAVSFLPGFNWPYSCTCLHLDVWQQHRELNL